MFSYTGRVLSIHQWEELKIQARVSNIKTTFLFNCHTFTVIYEIYLNTHFRLTYVYIGLELLQIKHIPGTIHSLRI